MNENFEIIMNCRNNIENKILEFADEQQDLTRSDFQGRATIVAQDIIETVMEMIAEMNKEQ